MIADTSPRVMDEMLWDIRSKQLWSKEELSGTEIGLVQEAELIELHTNRRLKLAPALAGAATVGIFFMGVVGEAKYDIRQNPDFTPQDVSGQLIPGNTLTVDNWIPIGDTGVSIPNLFTLSYGNIMQHDIVTTEQATAKGSTVSDLADNPVAGSNLQLTGQEYAIDKDVARDILQGIKDKGGRVSEVGIMGLASDEYRGEMGIENPEQKDLALQRAEVAKNALVDTAEEMGVALPDDIELRGEETVQPTEQIEKLTSLAEKHGLSLGEALTRYNGGRYLPEDLTKVLKESIVRGADYSVDYTVNTKSTGYTLEPAGDTRDSVSPLLPMGIGALGGFSLGLTAAAIAGYKGRGRKRRNEARRRVKAAEKS